MRFAVIDSHNRVLRSWDTGDALRERLVSIVSREFRFLKLRPVTRREIEAAVDESIAAMVHEFGLDVSRTH
jgi:hypothetical protein